MEGTARDARIAFGVDRLVMRAGRLFGWGWVVHAESVVNKVELRLGESSDSQCLTANYGLMREDVVRALPAMPHAGMSGFVVTGYINRKSVGKPFLLVHLETGGTIILPISDVLESDDQPSRRIRSLKWMLGSVWRRLCRLDFKGIVERARAQNYLAPTLEDEQALSSLLPHLTDVAEIFVIIDHNMGGGANHYRQQRIEEKIAAGIPVVLCTYILPTLDYRFHVWLPGQHESVFRASSFLAMEALIDRAPAVEVFLNSPVSFDDPLLLAEWLGQLRKGRKAIRLTLTVHDYFMACPSFVLLDADQRYCGVPDLVHCATCISRHHGSYIALSPPTPIPAWRASWGRCLDAADEIRCFSESTQKLLLRAYPALDQQRLSVVPHHVDFIPQRMPRIDPDAPLTIGIVGQISVQKGAGIVADMVGLIEHRGLPIRVVVLGTLDVVVQSDLLRVTGTYQRDDLIDLIEKFKLNMFLFPSICPETFSYVTEEIIRMDLPVVAFDLGAPAERLRSYRNGRICVEVSAETALATLIEFHQYRQSCPVSGV